MAVRIELYQPDECMFCGAHTSLTKIEDEFTPDHDPIWLCDLCKGVGMDTKGFTPAFSEYASGTMFLAKVIFYVANAIIKEIWATGIRGLPK